MQSILWFGPYIYLSPGIYNVTFVLSVTNNSQNNSYELLSWTRGGQVIFGSANITGRDFPAIETWTNISMIVSINNVWNKIEFPAGYGHWKGTIAISGLDIKQISW